MHLEGARLQSCVECAEDVRLQHCTAASCVKAAGNVTVEDCTVAGALVSHAGAVRVLRSTADCVSAHTAAHLDEARVGWVEAFEGGATAHASECADVTARQALCLTRCTAAAVKSGASSVRLQRCTVQSVEAHTGAVLGATTVHLATRVHGGRVDATDCTLQDAHARDGVVLRNCHARAVCAPMGSVTLHGGGAASVAARDGVDLSHATVADAVECTMGGVTAAACTVARIQALARATLTDCAVNEVVLVVPEREPHAHLACEGRGVACAVVRLAGFSAAQPGVVLHVHGAAPGRVVFQDCQGCVV
jgi:hypothetical protein